MDSLDPSALQVVGGILLLAVLFIIREFASGALKKAGEEFWVWSRRRRSDGQGARSDPNDGAGTGDVEDDRSPCLLPLGRGEADTTAIRRPALRRAAPAESGRKSA
jgi:hypothetical protein